MSQNNGKTIFYVWPTQSRRITSYYGFRSHPNPTEHLGIDIGATKRNIEGDALYAVGDGEITRIGTTSTGSSVLELKLEDGNSAVYIHGKYTATRGSIKEGEELGIMSDIGARDNVHLHFEIRINGRYDQTIDPLKFLY